VELQYECKAGPIEWDGVRVNAFVLEGVPRKEEHGFLPNTVYRYTADHPDLIAEPNLWAVFLKRAFYVASDPEGWVFYGCGSGPRKSVPAPSTTVPQDVIEQLEDICSNGEEERWFLAAVALLDLNGGMDVLRR
jgi:hypothetical protein